MRDLHHYPITKEEVIQTLERLLDRETQRGMETMVVGDITPLCIAKAIEIITATL